MRNWEALSPADREKYEQYETFQKKKIEDEIKKGRSIWDNTAAKNAVQRQADYLEKLTVADDVNAVALASVVNPEESIPIVARNCEEREEQKKAVAGTHARNAAITNSKKQYAHIIPASVLRRNSITGEIESIFVNGRDETEIAQRRIERKLRLVERIQAGVNKIKATLARSDNEIDEMKRAAILKRKSRQAQTEEEGQQQQ